MKDYFSIVASWYLNKRNKKQNDAKKKINDEKLKEVVERLKQLDEFVKFLNEKAFTNRHERKRFWGDVQKGLPVVEDTLKRILSRYGVKEETMKEIEKRKNEKIEAIKEEERKRQLQKTETEKKNDNPSEGLIGEPKE